MLDVFGAGPVVRTRRRRRGDGLLCWRRAAALDAVPRAGGGGRGRGTGPGRERGALSV